MPFCHLVHTYLCVCFLVAQTVKRLSRMRETRVRSLGREDPLQKEMATHSSILAWRTPWTEEPGRLQSMGSQQLDMAKQLTHHHHHQEPPANAGERSPGGGQASHSGILALEDPMDRGAWESTVHGVAKSWTQLS